MVPNTALIAELTKASTYPQPRKIESLGNIYIKERDLLQQAAKTQNPVAVRALEKFNTDYPQGSIDFIRKNMDLISSGQGSSQGSKFGRPTIVE